VRPAGRHARRTSADTGRPASRQSDRIQRVLFPDGRRDDLPATLQERYDRLDMAYAIGVLMTNRDLTRRLADDTGVPSPDVPAGTWGAGRGRPGGG
jgi:hypothetical protein